MGVSTDAILVFGIACGDEDEVPGFMLGFDDFNEYLNSISGLPEYGEEGHSFDAQRKFSESVPADMTLNCSYDYPMYILAVRGTEMRAWRGSPMEITSLDVPVEKVEAFKAWVSERGIVGEPKWLLCSLWG